MHKRADAFASGDLRYGVGCVHVEDVNWNLVFGEQRECSGVHDLEAVHERIVV